jgi:glucose/arabinose dehydrogenase
LISVDSRAVTHIIENRSLLFTPEFNARLRLAPLCIFNPELRIPGRTRTMIRRKILLAAFVALALSSSTFAQLDPLPDIPRGTIAVNLQPVATGMAAPLYGISPPGDTSRLFVLEQNGLVRILENGTLLPGAALDLQSRVSPPLNPASANDERGLLGLAFHPGFNTPASPGFRTLYTYTSEPTAGNPLTFPVPVEPTQPGEMNNYVNVVSEYKVSPTSPNVIDPASRRVIFTIGKNAGNHNGGTVAFGPDNYLYLATGDGGNANDRGMAHLEPLGNAQVITGGNVLGKMLRIDPLNPSLTAGSSDPVSANGQYRIPADNPFTGAGEIREVYAYGLRNPYRFAFDRANGELILADVGQGNIEEIDRIVRGGNYGWAVKEGTFLFNRNPPQGGSTLGANSPGVPAGMIDPISGPGGTLQYDHTDGISITGGFVYRGTAIPELVGKYVFGDLAIRSVQGQGRIDGRLFYADLTQGTIHEFLLPQFANDQLPNSLTVHGFGEDGNGELYAMVTNTPPNGTGGIVYKSECRGTRIFEPLVRIERAPGDVH